MFAYEQNIQRTTSSVRVQTYINTVNFELDIFMGEAFQIVEPVPSNRKFPSEIQIRENFL